MSGQSFSHALCVNTVMALLSPPGRWLYQQMLPQLLDWDERPGSWPSAQPCRQVDRLVLLCVSSASRDVLCTSTTVHAYGAESMYASSKTSHTVITIAFTPQQLPQVPSPLA